MYLSIPQYSVSYSVQYSVNCRLQSRIQYSVQYCVHYTVSYHLQEAGKGCCQFDIWLKFIVHYSVHCNIYWVQCTFYFSIKYTYMWCPGNQWCVNIQPVKNKSYVGPKLLACFSLLAAMQEHPVGEKVIHMI